MHDIAIIGGGHNGLVAAGLLARANLSVCVVERRDLLGGASVTEELWPGFRSSRAAYVAGLLRPSVIRELELERFGLSLIARRPSSFTPLPDGRALILSPEPGVSADSIAAFSQRDARRFGDYEALLEVCASLVEPLLDVPPPDPGQLRAGDAGPLWRVARRLLPERRRFAEAMGVFLAPAADTLRRFFESEPLLSTLATDAIIGAWTSPGTPGSGYVLLHHVMGETHGERGVWAYVRGGMGGLAEALAASARAAGAEIRTAAPVSEVMVRDGKARGLCLENGEEIEARFVLSGIDPHHTFCELVPDGALPEDFLSDVRAIDYRSPVAKINLALDRLPRFRASASDGPLPEHAATIHLGATDLAGLERSFDAARAGVLPERPMIEMTLPSSVDDSLAPCGRHVASLFVQHVPSDRKSWTGDLREGLAKRVFSLIDEAAPGFSDSILHHEVLAPPDVERIFGLRGGNIFQGAMSLDRLLYARPVAGYSRYRTPIDGLYLCGAAAHPGGGVMGACGRNAAAVVLRDVRRASRG
ncbi:MAG: NAD(P)/FAD-dependent oxidoreductase [Myxococcales bacterium]|nr:NAD(P)/FAD-dependent oxidoreductase [Myxococcales bacterium]